jgi:hypothetical protein
MERNLPTHVEQQGNREDLTVMATGKSPITILLSASFYIKCRQVYAVKRKGRAWPAALEAKPSAKIQGGGKEKA